MVLAMFSFAVEDAVIKVLLRDISGGQILSTVCFLGFIGFALSMRAKGVPLWHRDFLAPSVTLRSLCDVVGSMLFVTSLSLIPLTTASAVIQATPLVVAMGAALFLGQSVGWRRWLAIAVGFVGVLIIIRPGMEGFTPATLLAVGGMLGLAIRDLITRALRVDLSGGQLALHTFALIVPAGAVVMWVTGQTPVMPTAGQWGLLCLASLIAMGAYLALVAATRTGNAGIISSFRYSRMVFALIIGYLVFAEIPDAETLIGAAIIIASGIYTLWREASALRASTSETSTL